MGHITQIHGWLRGFIALFATVLPGVLGPFTNRDETAVGGSTGIDPLSKLHPKASFADESWIFYSDRIRIYLGRWCGHPSIQLMNG